MIKLRIEEILHEKRIKKTEFAEMLGIAKQNVNTLLETRNLDKIKEIADALGVDYMDLLVEKKEDAIPTINGYIEYNNQIYAIKNIEDFNNLANIINNDNR